MSHSARRLARWHQANAVCSALTGRDLLLARRLVDAVEAALGEDQGSDVHFSAALEQVRATLAPGEPGDRFLHVAAGDLGDGQWLWLQSQVHDGLHELGRGPAATLLVTGLAEAVRGPARRWTARRRSDYAELVAWIAAAAAALAGRSDLKVIVA